MSTVFTPYQVDFSIQNTSKTFGFSKKRVSFKFGVANPNAVSEGLTGAHCRGSEHEIIFVWSLNSGKRQIIADGKDVHYSESGQNGWTSDQVFQHHFQLRVPGYASPMRCHLITQPPNRDVPSVKPFDLRVNGISYFSFSKIFELGTSRMVSRNMRGGKVRRTADGEDPYCTPEERQAIAAAKLASIRDMREHEAKMAAEKQAGTASTALTSSMTRDEGNLISFGDDPTPPPSAPRGQSNFMSSVTMDSVFGGGGGAPAPSPYAQQPYSNYSINPQQMPQQQQQQSAYGQSPFGAAPAPYGAAPAPYGQPPVAPAPSPYGQAPSTALAPAYGNPPAPPTQPPPMPPQQQQQQQQQNPYFQPMPSQMPPNQQPQQYTSAPNLMSPTNQSVASYGSAPTFAQPPHHRQQTTAPPSVQHSAPGGYPTQTYPQY